MNPLPATISSATFQKVTATFYVPDQTALTAYRAASIWSGFTYEIYTKLNETENNLVNVFSSGCQIIIDNSSPDEIIEIYRIDGSLVKSIKSSGNRIVIPLQQKGLYLVKTATNTYKVIV
jgi:hypothetical protein